jgi:hypothetical protein
VCENVTAAALTKVMEYCVAHQVLFAVYMRDKEEAESFKLTRGSRVVPGIAVTMAASRRSNMLKKEDLPLFGGPVITTHSAPRIFSADL